MFYGWRIVGGSVLTQALQAGLLVYSFGAIATALEGEFGSTREQVMLGATFLSIVTNIISPFGGIQVDRGSVRKLMLLGICALVLGLLVLSQARALWQAWVAFGLILPVGNLFLGQLTTSALITRWFERIRGRAMGISAVGTSLGGFVIPVLFASLSELYDWRTALIMIAVGAFVITCPIIWFVIADWPAEKGQIADGVSQGREDAPTQNSSPATSLALTTTSILTNTAFWIETIVIGFLLFIYMGMLNNLYPHATGLGLEPVQAASLMSVLTVCSVLGKLGLGSISDKLDLRYTMWIAMGLMALGSLILLSAANYMGLAAAVIAFGFAAGGLLPVWGMMVAKSFGPHSFGRALGVMNLAMMPITALAAPFAGRMYDNFGSYDVAFQVYIGIIIMAAILLYFLKFPDEGSVA